MEFITNVVAAEEDEYRAVGESSNPLEEWSGFGVPGLDTVRMATIHSMLTGETLQAALELCEPVYVAESGTVLLRLTDNLLAILASIDEAPMESVADELAATEEFEGQGWSAETALSLLASLSELAQLAESQGQVLFVWMHLVPGE